ncbi:MAG: hypothetical protein AVDCRST_MAG49-830, partial [uncultured Thermomicrobiales bacterium]
DDSPGGGCPGRWRRRIGARDRAGAPQLRAADALGGRPESAGAGRCGAALLARSSRPPTVCRVEGHGTPRPRARPGDPGVVPTGTRRPGDEARPTTTACLRIGPGWLRSTWAARWRPPGRPSGAGVRPTM